MKLGYLKIKEGINQPEKKGRGIVTIG